MLQKALYAVCNYGECHYAECHYAECHYAECGGAENCNYDGVVGIKEGTRNINLINPFYFFINADAE
jgi:hypothetical protein